MDSRTDIENTGHERQRIPADVGEALNGSLGNVHAYSVAIAHAGADAVKIQTRTAGAESDPPNSGKASSPNRTCQDSTNGSGWSCRSASGGASRRTLVVMPMRPFSSLDE